MFAISLFTRSELYIPFVMPQDGDIRSKSSSSSSDLPSCCEPSRVFLFSQLHFFIRLTWNENNLWNDPLWWKESSSVTSFKSFCFCVLKRRLTQSEIDVDASLIQPCYTFFLWDSHCVVCSLIKEFQVVSILPLCEAASGAFEWTIVSLAVKISL